VLPGNPGGYGFSVRIVSLLPSTTEILFAIGAGGDVVGVTFECEYPPEARSRRIVSTSALPSNLSAAEIDAAVSAALSVTAWRRTCVILRHPLSRWAASFRR
jgi:iron complex transport system substrate-binding protein